MAERSGTLREKGEIGGAEYGRRAIEVLLGEENMRAAVDYYISGEAGSELARDVLKTVRPWSAMKRCYEIYGADGEIVRRRLAVELLRAVADERAVVWVGEFLEDTDDEIQMWGAGILEQLADEGRVAVEDVGELLEKARHHANPAVREIALGISL
ncbi:MAG TPA: hypothetical protein VF666_10140 [Pyrinomonadaceae bacterium]